MRALAVLALLLAAGCATSHPAHRDARFVILASGDFTPQEIQRVRDQLEAGTRALEKYLGPAPATKFPVVVNLRSGRGVSHSGHGRGPIELYWVKDMRSPIVHELTHVLAGYTASNGHWTQEGFASYMQDRYGEDRAFPTRRMAHALVKVIVEERSLLPMRDVMRDRDRRTYFGLRAPWERWLAYTQSTSLCFHLIERYGAERFLKAYDVPFELIDFNGLYGKSADALVDEWLGEVGTVRGDTERARAVFSEMKATLGGR